MSVNYSSVILIGADYDSLTWNTLTDKARSIIREEVLQDSPICYEWDDENSEITNQDEIEEAWEEQCIYAWEDRKGEWINDYFGFSGTIGNYFTGVIDYVGIEIHDLNANHQDAIDEWLGAFTVKPELHHGVLVW